MLGYIDYNRLGNDGFTDPGRGRTTPSVQTCPVCLCQFDAQGGRLPDNTRVPRDEWVAGVCKAIKDDTVNGGYQAGCLAQAFPPA